MRILNKLLVLTFIITLFSCGEVYYVSTGGYKTKVGGGLGIITTEQEIELGKGYVPLAVEENRGRYPDKVVQDYVNRIGLKIARYTPRKLPYKFYVINAGGVNAFALPGGFIFVNRGLILVLDKESQLAGVLAHELGHVNARHHAKFMEKMLGVNFLYNLLGSALGDKSYGHMLLQLSGVGLKLLSLKWSRDQEREADKLGILFSYKAGYDPHGLLETFVIFQKLGKVNAPEWMLTHPLPQNRYMEVKGIISKLKPKPNLIKDSPEFHKIKNRILSTKKSYEFYSLAVKELSKNPPNTRLALEYLNKSISIFPNNNASLTLRALIYSKTGNYKKAIADGVKACQLDDLYFSPHFITGYSYYNLKNYDKAILYLNKARNLIPQQPDPYYYLGRIYEDKKEYLLAYKYYKTAISLSKGKRKWAEDAKARMKRLEKYLNQP